MDAPEEVRLPMADLECLHDAERKELSRESHEKRKKEDKDRDKRKSDKKHHGDSKSRRSKYKETKREEKEGAAGYRERSHRSKDRDSIDFASDDRFIVERDDKELIEKEDKEWLKERLLEEFDRHDKGVHSKSSRSHESGGGKSEKSSRSKHKHKDDKKKRKESSDCFSPRSKGTSGGKEPDTSGSRYIN